VQTPSRCHAWCCSISLAVSHLFSLQRDQRPYLSLLATVLVPLWSSLVPYGQLSVRLYAQLPKLHGRFPARVVVSQLVGVPSSPCLCVALSYHGFLLLRRARSVSSSLVVPSSPLHATASHCLATVQPSRSILPISPCAGLVRVIAVGFPRQVQPPVDAPSFLGHVVLFPCAHRARAPNLFLACRDAQCPAYFAHPRRLLASAPTRQSLLSHPRQHATVVVFIEFANALLPIRLSSLRVLSSSSFSLSCTRILFSAHQRALSARSALIPNRVVGPIIPCSTTTSPTYSKHDLVVVPRVSKKSQESDEDEASKRGVHQVREKSSNILRDSCSIRQNYSVKEKIFSN
jgi:hypothetical protein